LRISPTCTRGYLEVASAHGFAALMGGLHYRAGPDWASERISRDGLWPDPRIRLPCAICAARDGRP